MPTCRAGKVAAEQRGFSYAMVLAAIVIVGVTVETGYIATAHTVRKEREAELLFRGEAYRRAIRSYYEAGGVRKVYPPSLEHLLRDPRAPSVRHIRSLYTDPMATDEKKAWNLIKAADGGIAGVVSTSQETPLRQANFPQGLEKLSGAKSYAEWIFEFAPAATTTGPTRQPSVTTPTQNNTTAPTIRRLDSPK